MRGMVLILLLVAVAAPLTARAQPASDIIGHWAEDRITLLLQRNIAQLFPDQTFRPEQSITRAEFVRWLVSAAKIEPLPAGLSSFVDVPPYHPAAPYIEAAVARGLISRAPAFLPDVPITRIDAVGISVRAIGAAFEATILSLHSLPFDDLASLPEVLRGTVAVAMLTEPALLKEPSTASFRPNDPMMRGEAASLTGGVLLAVETGLVLRSTTPVAGGVNLMIEKRGVLRAQAVWRVQVGAFTTEENAQRLAAVMRERGLPVLVEFQDGVYKVRVGNFASVTDATQLKQQLGREGYPTWVIQTLPSFEGLAGPSREAALVLDPAAGIRIVPAVGDGAGMRRVRVSEMARRAGALAATNGDFFSTTGDPLGCLMIAGELLSEPDPQRTCAGFTPEGAVIFDRVRGDLTVTAGAATARIDGINRDRRADELILYQPAFAAATHTNAFGVEAVIVNSVVTAVADLGGNTAIPRDGIVLSGHGRARQWILQTLQVGTPVSIQLRLAAPLADPRWATVIHAVGGGPRLLTAGQFAGGENFPETFTDRRHPRTAIGVLADGRIVLLVVDGRQPAHSLGMTLLELAMELRRLGAVDAMNLDGGGSSTLVVGDRVVNLPSDETGERPVADAVLVMPPPQGP